MQVTNKFHIHEKKVYLLRWVSTEKYIDGMRNIKVKVVTREFEEDYIYIKMIRQHVIKNIGG